MKSSKKELFVALGTAQFVGEKKRFVPKSPAYLNQKIAGLPLNQLLELKFSVAVATRSSSQLAYHWVLMGLLSEHTGFTKEEMHDALMRLKFGTKTIRLGSKNVEVRQSISDGAKMAKSMAVELIEYDLSMCAELEVRVPTPEELGYMVDDNGKIIK